MEYRIQGLTKDERPYSIDVYVDGSYDVSSEKGGWAFVALCNDETIASASGSFEGKSNNTLELVAALRAAEWASTHVRSRAVTIWSDSTHVVQGCNHWRAIWKNNGWRRYNPNPKARNRSIPDAGLWKQLDRHLAGNPRFTVAWCKGHQGNIGNERADRMAGEAHGEG